ncbi:MAG: tetratricopeptide repeat protein, partial [Candidatus Sumerlaeia bacterium]|nr:tetratricopeptide repeat protein [Candidatus Sumerlaeia bacterium]
MLQFALAKPDGVADEMVVSVDDIFSTEIKVEDILTSAVMTPTPVPPSVTPEEEGIFIIIKPTPSPAEKFELQLAEALTLLSKGNLESAKIALQKLATELPVSEQSSFALYLSALIENNEESERELLLQLVKRYPDSKWANLAEYKLAEIEFIKGNYKQALNLFLKFARKNPQGTLAVSSRLYVAKCLMQEKQYDKAVVLLKGMLLQSEQAKNDPGVYETLAQCFIDTNKFDEAEKILLLIVEKFPHYHFLARVYMNLG